jgi:hypothetical protein
MFAVASPESKEHKSQRRESGKATRRAADPLTNPVWAGLALGGAPPTSSVRTVQRSCACGGGCDSCRGSASGAADLLEDERLTVQRSSASAGVANDTSDVASLMSGSRGDALDPAGRSFLESGFGRDLRDIRVHTDRPAAAAASALSADAFTTGRDVYFADRKYAPQTTDGRHLLAHEVAHTIQQSAGQRPANTVATRPSSLIVGAPGDRLEAEADRAADAALAGAIPRLGTSRGHTPGQLIQRSPDDCADDPDIPLTPSAKEFGSDDELNSVRASMFEWNTIDLRPGSTGPGVALVQRLLLNTVCTGVDRTALKSELAAEKYGSATRQAVRRFQRDHTDAIGRPLVDDGRVGPLALGAMDKSAGLAPQLPALDPEGTGDCYGVAKHGPGEAKILDKADVPPFPGFFLSETVWEVSSFDIARHFVKTEHRSFLRDSVVKEINSKPADKYLVRLIGEASTTAGQSFNLPLSKRRAHCVRQALLEAGLDSESRLEPDIGLGETYAYVRRWLSGATPIDEFEDRSARKVSIVLAPRDTGPCVKEQASSKFTARVVCGGPGLVRVNIGDISDPHAPTYREFIWVHLPWPPGCAFRAGPPPPIEPFYEWVTTDVDFHLALGDPDQIYAPTEFSGPATHHANGADSRLVGKNPFRMGFDGFWEPETCKDTPSETAGQLTPIGPVKCGLVPAPPHGDCDPGEKKKGPCTDDYKKSKAQRYRALLGGVSGDISKYLPTFLKPFVSAGVNGAFVAFGTTDLKGPQITRAFIYVGGTLKGAGADLGQLHAAIAPEKDVGEPIQLDTGGYVFNSDFNEFWNAELVVHGGSNKIDVDAGDAGTFTFFSPVRNCGDERTYHGVIHSISPVLCPAKLPDEKIPEMKCEEGEDCSEKARLAGHHSFTVKVGRATIASLPLLARKLIDQDKYGCAITAAFVNIQSEDDAAGERIHREFVLVTRNDGCRFTVGQSHESKHFLFERQLATKDPDDILAPSDFAGGAWLNKDGELTIFAPPSLVRLKLPGVFDAACTAKRGAKGLVLPVSVVWCGEAPEPQHDTTPDTSQIDKCNKFKADNLGVVQPQIDKLKAGTYDDLLDSLPTNIVPVIAAPHEFYDKWLTMPGATIHNGVFVGWAIDASGQEVPIVAFADFRILAVNSDKSIVVEFLTGICAFDTNGQVVLLNPAFCTDVFARPGDRKRIPPLLYGPPEPPAKPKVQIAGSPAAAPAPAGVETGVVQRTCACGGSPGPDAECTECRNRRQSLSATTATTSLLAADDGTAAVDAGTLGSSPGATPASGGESSRSSHCSVTGSFEDIPNNQTLRAEFDSNGKLGAPFYMIARFTPNQSSCDCSCGEYRQYVRGVYKKNGSVVPPRPPCGVHATNLQEDCSAAFRRISFYGYRAQPYQTSRFTMWTQAAGCRFEGYDHPGISGGASGDVLEVNLDFQGVLVDTCNSDAILAEAEWSVAGTATNP